MSYVVKKGDLYHDGNDGWVSSQKKAFRFAYRDKGSFHTCANNTAGVYPGARVVRLVRIRYRATTR